MWPRMLRGAGAGAARCPRKKIKLTPASSCAMATGKERGALACGRKGERR